MNFIRITYFQSLFFLLLCAPYIYTKKQNNRSADNNYTVGVIGTGYVGLVTGACLADFGNKVICADIDSVKVANLKKGILPIYEPGLEEIVAQNFNENRLVFSDNIAETIRQSDVLFIAVGTPMGDDGSADLAAIKAVTRAISQNMNSFKVIVTKSTVPVGTGKWIEQMLIEQGVKQDQFAIVSNPEFLKEGSAVEDFLHPDRLVVGSESEKAHAIMRIIYARLLAQNTPYVATNVVTSELIKYASNAFLAVKISFINELANLCDKTGADVKVLADAMGLDRRINRYFLNPGPGFGGSCFPKDTEALLFTAKKYNLPVHTVEAALLANELQKKVTFNKLANLMNNDFNNKTVAVLGLAFKANTDDVRYSPAITTIEQLLAAGAHVKTYDPQAMKTMQVELSRISDTTNNLGTITYCDSIEETVTQADAVVVMTEWDEFKNIDLADVAARVNAQILVDARNILDPEALRANGFTCDDIGRSCLCKN